MADTTWLEMCMDVVTVNILKEICLVEGEVLDEEEGTPDYAEMVTTLILDKAVQLGLITSHEKLNKEATMAIASEEKIEVPKAQPPCQVTKEGDALYKILSALSSDLCLQEWTARTAIEDALAQAKDPIDLVAIICGDNEDEEQQELEID